jgi:formylglycine-generating enzyme
MLRPLRINIADSSFLMIPVEGGTFNMGDEVGDLWSACGPVHSVSVSSFYLAQFPVTQILWQTVMEKEWDQLSFVGHERPIESVSWNDAQVFLEKLQHKTDFKFRLPSESEWEYAARGGKYNQGCTNAGSKRVKEVAWYNENSHSETKPLGRKFPNELGLYDMSGNVWEWCADDWHSNYEAAPVDGSAWIDAKRGSNRVFRGGCWSDFPRYCRSAHRNPWSPDNHSDSLGFRLALSLPLTGWPDGCH